LTKTELESALKKHITEVVSHYKGKIYAWDVVNEAFEEDGTLRESIWHKNFGHNYIAEALKTAHEADPNAKLYINDYSIARINPKSNGLFKLVSELKAQGVPIHGVGFQSHFHSYHMPQDFVENLERFSKLGLDVAITELDIKVRLPVTHEKLTEQAKEYASVFKTCLSVSRCVGVTTWGIRDKQEEVGAEFGDALMWDVNSKPKPAVAAVEALLKEI
jgi:endo-1,4-beta-xylanase